MAIKIVRYREWKHAGVVGRPFHASVAELRKSKGGFYPDPLMDEWLEWSVKGVPVELKEQGVKCFVAMEGPRVVGTFGYQSGSTDSRDRTYLDEKLPDLGHFARLRHLFVDPEFRKQGIASRLFEAVLDDLRSEKEHGDRKFLHTYAYVILSAHGFYEKKGMLHLPELDWFGNEYYDPEINRRIAERGICTHFDYSRLEGKTPRDFFFIKRDI